MYHLELQCVYSNFVVDNQNILNFMNKYEIDVRKLTDVELMREACETTFLGTSKQSLISIYKSEHSPVRTQLFWIKFKRIPLFIATHLIRHHVGSVPFQLTCRDDKEGGNPGLPQKIDDVKRKLHHLTSMNPEEQREAISKIQTELSWLEYNADRYTPVNLSLLINAQSLIDMSKLRLCNMAHSETIELFKELKEAIKEQDASLAAMMVRKCVYRAGLCGEPRCCMFNRTPSFKKELGEYLANFNNKQVGLIKQ